MFNPRRTFIFSFPSVSGLLFPVDQHINTSLFLPWKQLLFLKSFYWERLLNNLRKTSKRAGEKTTPNLCVQFSTFMDTLISLLLTWGSSPGHSFIFLSWEHSLQKWTFFDTKQRWIAETLCLLGRWNVLNKMMMLSSICFFCWTGGYLWAVPNLCKVHWKKKFSARCSILYWYVHMV